MDGFRLTRIYGELYDGKKSAKNYDRPILKRNFRVVQLYQRAIMITIKRENNSQLSDSKTK